MTRLSKKHRVARPESSKRVAASLAGCTPCRDSERATRTIVGVAFALLLLIGPIRAQEPVNVVPFEGSEIFCHILKHFKFRPIGSIEELSDDTAEETLIIIFGKLDSLQAIVDKVPDNKAFAYLLASDHRTERFVNLPKADEFFLARNWYGPWRMRISGDKVAQDPESAYQRLERCPLLRKEDCLETHPLLRGVTSGIATNRPSFLVMYRDDFQNLAAFGNDCSGGGFSFRSRSNENVGFMFATKENQQPQTLILAGHGVFMNGMIAQEDNDNGLFTINTIRWLRGPENKRKYALMIHDGKVIDSFDLPLTQLPNVPLPPVQIVNQMLRELENEGVFNRFLEEVVGWPLVLRFAILLATMALFVYGFYRLFPMRYRHESVPLIVGLPRAAATSRSLPLQRQWELLTQDNLWEPAQALARQWFIDHAQVHAPLWDAADQSPPALTVRGGWMARRRLTQQMQTLWGFATRDPSQSVSRREFSRVTEALTALNDASDAGQLSFSTNYPEKSQNTK